MSNPEQLALLQQGVDGWNGWRDRNPDTKVDLFGADLDKTTLAGANLSNANLRYADFSNAILESADLSGANLEEARLVEADLTAADLTEANLRGAYVHDAKLWSATLDRADLAFANLTESDLWRASLIEADLTDAHLSNADFSEATLNDAKLRRAHLDGAKLIKTSLRGATLDACRIYGISVWDVETDERTSQTELVITEYRQSAVMVDDLEVAQFIHLLLNREKLRNVLNTMMKKGVLILGRFSDGGLEVLQAIASWLRRNGYLPMFFDFPRPDSKTYTETVKTLAGLSRFVIVDLSGPSVPQEITATVDLHEIPFVPVLQEGRGDWSLFKDFLVKDRVLGRVGFRDSDHLLKILPESVIEPAEKLIAERQRKIDEIFGEANRRT